MAERSVADELARETAAQQRILQPGVNCWRVARASRAAVLVDAAPYFAALEEAMDKARRSIIIAGWDFDPRIRLRQDDPACPTLGDYLRRLVETRPELEVRILVWSFSLVHAPGRKWPMLFGWSKPRWQRHPRIQVRMDRRHGLYSAHHQKIVCIDDRVAFCGGLDLTVMRWDTPDHRADNPHRLMPDGARYRPVHDIQMAVEGEAARALATLARDRWQLATGERPGVFVPLREVWPDRVTALLQNTSVAISRTRPRGYGLKDIRESARLTIDAIEAARDFIYIEQQYLTSRRVRDALARSLEQPEGPEIVILLTCSCQGLLEQLVMGINRDRLIHYLRHRDRHGRFHVYYPVVPFTGEAVGACDSDGDLEVLVHAKLMVVDDRLLRVGSSNLNNRSEGLDTECDLTLEAAGEAERAAIAAVREQVMAEHLDCAAGEVRAAFAREGSLARTIEALNRNGRRLKLMPAMGEDGPESSVPGTRLFDPARPLSWRRLFARRRTG